MKYRRVRIDGDAIVVAFDICSSTNLIEELTLNGEIEVFEDLLTDIKLHLAKAQEKVLFDPYKFTGDGWILLFPADSDGTLIFEVLQDLCKFYKKTFSNVVLRHLATPPKVMGLTFGIDRGPVRRMTMYGQQEYIGRALNVACRLQAAAKDRDSSPEYKALISNTAYNKYFSIAEKRVKVWRVRRKLRNIQGGADFLCKKIEFFNFRDI
jgi:class 3 adenylate cyclase